MLLKKLTALLIAAGMITTQAAFADIGTQFDNRTGKLTLSGALPDDAADNWVTIEVINPEDNKTVFLTQTTAGADLSYTAELAFAVDLTHKAENPLYKVRVNYMHDGAAEEYDVYYTPDAFTQMWIDIASSDSTEKTAEIFKNGNLNEIAAQLGLDGTSLDADTLADYVYQKTSKRTLSSVSDCRDCVREAIIFGEIKTGGAKKANEYIALSDSIVDSSLKINSQSEAYKLYLGSSEKIKAAFSGAMTEYYNDGSEFSKAYNEQLLIKTIENSDNNLQITAALDTCGKSALGSEFENSEYAKLKTNSDKEKFAGILKDELNDNSISAAFANAETKYKEQNNNNGGTSDSKPRPSGGSGGGSGSSGGGSNITFDRTDEVKSSGNNLITDMFTDLDTVPWAKEAINALAKEKIVSGVSEYSFEPDRLVTREEFVKLLTLACGIKTSGAKSSFDDVLETDWFYPYVSAAYESEIVSGVTQNFFGTGSYISREDMAVMVYRALEKKELIGESAEKTEFSDNAEISDYAKDPVGIIAAMGIINGTGNNEFSPNQNATRAQAAKIIYELTGKLK